MEFFLIASTHFLALLSPGPDFFLIISRALRYSRRHCVALCAGIASANGFYIGFALLGIESIRTMPGLLLVLQYCGAAYLIYLGVMLLMAPASTLFPGQERDNTHVWLISSPYLTGCLSALLNPKNGIFYLSLFSVMINETTSLPVRCFYGIWMVTVVFLWDCCVALWLNNIAAKKQFALFVGGIEKCCGLLLVCAGVILTLY